ncbi:sortase [Kitasatospora sp. NPDC052896]|uniref:sortase n=1 Tax=Kitasatospora sp. NPDC052896 TaxID=3364061 RepID=UPI0037C71AE6
MTQQLAAPAAPLDSPAVPGPPSGPPVAEPPVAVAGPAPRAVRRPGRLLRVGWSATLLAGLLLGFVGYLVALSGLQEQHYQAATYQTFRYQLANATAPTGAAADGTPVAVLDIPAIGLEHAVVVEGTSGRDLMRGPGHRRDTALPGQQGTAVLFGRGTAFGAPFGRLAALRLGDKIYATTGQGRFSYTVNAYGDGSHPIRDPAAPARLVLTTSDSGWIPTGTVLVGARLDGPAQDNPYGRPALLPADHALAVDAGALAALQLWALALFGAVLAATVAARSWQRRAAYLASAPVVAALLWAVYENAAALLPNLY